MDSPCHHCPKCPCKEHDTCREYQEYRAEIDKIKKTEDLREDYSRNDHQGI